MGDKKTSMINTLGNKVLFSSAMGDKVNHSNNLKHKRLYDGQSDIYKNSSNNSSLIYIPTGLLKNNNIRNIKSKSYLEK